MKNSDILDNIADNHFGHMTITQERAARRVFFSIVQPYYNDGNVPLGGIVESAITTALDSL